MQLSQSFFVHNRKQLCRRLPKKGIVIIAGNARMQRNADNPYPFRQDSNFYYLTGIEEPCATLVIDTVHNREWIMLPGRSRVQAIFDGLVDTKKCTDISGIKEIIDETEGWQRIKQLADSTFYMPAKPAAQLDEMFTNPYRAATARKLHRLTKNIHDIRNDLAQLRMIKTDDEVAIIDRAARITRQSITAVETILDECTNESAVEAELLCQFKQRGASGHAFTPIVASGDASCTLHYVANNAVLKKQVVLFDVGAELSNYSADISRTLTLTNDTWAKQVINAVRAAQQAVIKAIAPDMSWQQLAECADNEVGAQLVSLGLLKPGFTREQVRPYFPHAVSHFLGLDTHDAGDYTTQLQPGMVITVEPGIYDIKTGIGARFEDDILITKSGAKILGD